MSILSFSLISFFNSDIKTAEKYYKKAINKSSVEAMLNLGVLYTGQEN